MSYPKHSNREWPFGPLLDIGDLWPRKCTRKVTPAADADLHLDLHLDNLLIANPDHPTVAGRETGGHRKQLRRQHDNYPTRPEVVRAGYAWFQRCLPGFKPTKILEPGCGDTAPFLVEAPWPNVERVGCDIRSVRPCVEGALFVSDHDFLAVAPQHKVLQGADLIATNPPFESATAFMLRSLDLLAPYGFCLFLVRLSFLASQKRYKLWTEQVHLQYVGVIPTRQSFTGDGGTDVMDHIFVVFQKRRIKNLDAMAVLSWVSI